MNILAVPFDIFAKNIASYLTGKIIYTLIWKSSVEMRKYIINTEYKDFLYNLFWTKKEIYHRNSDKVQYREYRRDGLLEGFVTAYYMDGNKSTESFYIEGKLNGNCYNFYCNGYVSLLCNYKDGILDGNEYKYYDTHGICEWHNHYIEVDKSGSHLLYYKSGILRSHKLYVNGVLKCTYNK